MTPDSPWLVAGVGAAVLFALAGTPFGTFAAATLVAILAMLVFHPGRIAAATGAQGSLA